MSCLYQFKLFIFLLLNKMQNVYEYENEYLN
jgi:hypothetical protein